MAPIGFSHEMCVARLTKLLERLAGDYALIWPQNNSIRLPPDSRPEPDVTLLRLRDYRRDKPPTAEDVLLVIEMAETSIVSPDDPVGYGNPPLYAAPSGDLVVTPLLIANVWDRRMDSEQAIVRLSHTFVLLCRHAAV